MTRREWISITAAGIASAAPRSAPVGVQLYTVRSLMKNDASGTLHGIADIGYRAVEGGRADLLQLMPLLEKHGLKAPSASLETPLVTGEWNLWKAKEIGVDEAIESVKTIGAKYAVIAYLLPPERKDIRRFVDRANAVGEKCQKAGLTLCYHNHAFEFGGAKGERPIDIMLAGFDRKLVRFELDVFWVSVAGHDPVEFLREHSDRIGLVHLKDKMPGTPVQYSEAVKPQSFGEVGGGTLDFPAILKASSAAGAGHYFIEQDFTPGNPLDSLRKSFDYLRGLNAREIRL